MWAALDAEFYLAFDAGREDCIDLVAETGATGLLLLPTAYQEIADHCVSTTDEELRIHALDAMRFMAANGVVAAPPPARNVGTDAGLAQYLLDYEIVSERNQALILAEAACLEVECLLTLDSDIFTVDE